MSKYHVVVIGGGPVGCVAARRAASAGARVLLVERRESARELSPCTGLVSPRTLPALGVSESSILRRIRSVEAQAPNGHRLVLRATTEKAVVLDRSRLEEELQELAEEAGTTIRLGCNAVTLRPGRVTVRFQGGREEITTDVIVVATGLNGSFSSNASLSVPSRVFVAAQAVVEEEPSLPDEVRVHFGQDVAPLFFGWSVPAEPGRARVGLAVPPELDPALFLERLLTQHYPGISVRSRTFGRIPIGLAAAPTGDGTLLVGDAAGHVKPLSGGGLYTGAICGRIAGRIAARAARLGRTRREDLAEYPLACDRAIGGEVRFGLAARDLLESLSDEGIDDVFAALDHPDLLRFLGMTGDIDRLRWLPRHVAVERALWKRLLPLLALLDKHIAARACGNPVATPTADSL
jgi:digeranylgeranylglycerophospholipid reductase